MAHLIVIAASSGNNLNLANRFFEQAKIMGQDVELLDLCGLELPLYTPNTEKNLGKLEGIQSIADRLSNSKGWIVCSPEYNGSLPPVLNNLIAWLSVQDDDFRSCFNGRKVALATHSGGGGAHVIMAMRMQFSYLGCNVVGRSLTSNKNKTANPETIKMLIEEIVN
jgi:NAD(P)H-dependent FMN reductase